MKLTRKKLIKLLADDIAREMLKVNEHFLRKEMKDSSPDDGDFDLTTIKGQREYLMDGEENLYEFENSVFDEIDEEASKAYTRHVAHYPKKK